MNPELIKSFTAQTDIAKRRFVKLSSNDDSVAVATAASDVLIGVSQPQADTVTGEIIDVTFSGIAEIEASGVINKGAHVTADAVGKALATTTAGDEVGGIALQAAAADGDVILIKVVDLVL